MCSKLECVCVWSVWGTEKGEWGRKSVGVAPTPPARPRRGVRPLPGARGVLGYRQDWQPLGSALLRSQGHKHRLSQPPATLGVGVGGGHQREQLGQRARNVSSRAKVTGFCSDSYYLLLPMSWATWGKYIHSLSTFPDSCNAVLHYPSEGCREAYL